MIDKLENDKIESFEATEASADEWLKMVAEKWDATLLSKAKISIPVFPLWIHILTACTVGGRVQIFQERRFNL